MTGETETGRRVLLVEDEVMVAMHAADILGELGHSVVGLATNLTQALELATTKEFDFAVLDINLGGELSFPVADLLRERQIPFLFLTGYTSAAVTSPYRNEVRVRKPFRPSELARSIGQLRCPPASPV